MISIADLRQLGECDGAPLACPLGYLEARANDHSPQGEINLQSECHFWPPDFGPYTSARRSSNNGSMTGQGKSPSAMESIADRYRRK